MKPTLSLLPVVPLILSILSFSASSFADENPPAPPSSVAGEESAPSDRRVAVSFDAIRLFLRTARIHGELRLAPKLSAAVMGEIGAPIYKDFKFFTWGVGGQFIGYPIGHFDHGMQLAAEANYSNATITETPSTSPTTVNGFGSGLSVGGLIGYKIATPVGFTFNIQGGVGYSFAAANVTDSTGRFASASTSGLTPLLHLNFGWSF